MNKEIIDLTGKRFSRLQVICFDHYTLYRNKKVKYWKCLCDCGNYVIREQRCLISGKTKSCGCYQLECFKEIVQKHGKSQTHIYKVYYAMKKRCTNKNDERYMSYGGRGISICNEWLGEDGFINFYNWSMNNGYTYNNENKRNKISLDRINNNGNYCPENCRWTDNITQSNNKRNNIIIDYNGKTLSLKEWSKILKLDYHLLLVRLRNGWSVDRAFTELPFIGKNQSWSKNERI